MAVWPSNTAGAPECHGNKFFNNTVEFTYRAGGAGIFGGYGHEIHHCLFKDGTDSSAIRFTEDFAGYHFQNNTAGTGIRVYENTIIGRGTSQDLWNNARGAIEIYGAGIQYLLFENNDIINSPRHAIQLGGGQNLAFANTTITTTGLDNFNSPTGAANDLATTDPGVEARIAVLSNDSDPESDPLAILSVTDASHGTVTHDGLLATYSPDPGFAGSDSFTYTAGDGRGGTAAASVTVTVWEPCPYEMEICFTGYNGTETLANFPVLVKLGPERTGFSYSQFASPNGDDLRFRDAARNEIKYEIESWDPAGTSCVWVQVPALAKNTRIWAGWGSAKLAAKPSYTTDGSVWSGGYAAVYHANEDASTHRDSTANGRHGTPLGNTAAAAGMVAGADQFDGNGDAVRLPKTFGLFGGNQSVTVEFWFKADAVAPDTYYGTSPVVFQGRGENAWMLTFGDSMAGNSLSPRLNQGGWATPASAPGILTARWYYFSTTCAPSGTNNWKVFLDGALVSQGTRTGAVTADTVLNNQYGGSDEAGAGINRWFKGAMDEVRVSSVARSESWLWASWNTVFSNGTFATYGAMQEVGARYAFSVAAGGGGAVTGSASGDYLPGSPVSIAAVPNTYYHWSYWTGNVPANQTGQNPLTLTMDESRSVTAVFEANLAAGGAPEWWLAQFGWTANFDAAALSDSDGDGQTASQEFLAGTDPTDPSSALRAGIEADPPDGLLLLWSSVAGKSYRIEQASDLPGQWSVRASNIPAAPPLNSHTVALPPEGRLFFRIAVE